MKVRYKRICKRGHDTSLSGLYYNKIKGVEYPECAECRRVRERLKRSTVREAKVK